MSLWAKLCVVPRWVWLLALFVIGLEFVAPFSWRYYHNEIERPKLISSAKASGELIVFSPSKLPANESISSKEPYDLLITRETDKTRIETYFRPNGDKTVVVFRNGAWASTSTDFHSSQIQTPFFVVGMLFILFAIVVHIRATGDWMLLWRPKFRTMPPLAWGLWITGFSICALNIVGGSN